MPWDLKRHRRPKPKPLDPVEAYARIAPEYAGISERRRSYLRSIESLILERVPQPARSLIDIGAGDGTRSLRIARAASISRIVLLEPSPGMLPANTPAEIWPIRAEDLGAKDGSFDIILCLWNVLGHIFPESARAAVLKECAQLLAPNGRLFFDVNNRYNARAYGIAITALRYLRDRLSRDGDVTVRWNISGATCTTKGHVFTPGECEALIANSGLKKEQRLVVDYETGELRHSPFSGHLLYVLAPRSSPHASSQTRTQSPLPADR